MGNSRGKLRDEERYESLAKLPAWARYMLYNATANYSPSWMLDEIHAREAAGWDDLTIRTDMHLIFRRDGQKKHLTAFPGLVTHVDLVKGASYVKREKRRRRR